MQGVKAWIMWWRGLTAECLGRVTGNRRAIALGRLRRALARIASAHARANRQFAHQQRAWQRRHGEMPTRSGQRPRLVFSR